MQHSKYVFTNSWVQRYSYPFFSSTFLPHRKFKTYQDKVIEFISSKKLQSDLHSSVETPNSSLQVEMPSLNPRLAANSLLKINNSSKINTVLSMCSSILPILKGKLASVQAYDTLLHYLISNVQVIPHDQFPCVCYYGSLGKKNPLAKTLVKQVYNVLKLDQSWLREEASITEISILAHAFFVLDVKINSKPLQQAFATKLEEHLETEPFPMLIPVLKILRLSNCHPISLVHKLVDLLATSQAPLNLAEVSHILALVADSKIVVESVPLFESLRKILQSNQAKDRTVPHASFYHPAQRSRAKDFTRFLWAISCMIPPSLDASSSVPLLTELVQDFEKRLENQEFTTEPQMIADIALSFACLGLYPKPILSTVLTSQFVKTAMQQLEPLRLSRLALFLTCVNTEKPDMITIKHFGEHLLSYPRLPKPNVEKELRKRPLLRRAFQQALNHANEGSNGSLAATCRPVIPHLNIVSIVIKSPRNETCLEVLDSHVCLIGSCLPDRLMRLKMRLLPQLGYAVITVTPDDVLSGHVPILFSKKIE